MIKEAMLYEKLEGGNVRCALCSHRCKIAPSKRGVCCVRGNREGTLYTLVYGPVIAASVDPVEKKPLYHLLPGSESYSIAAVGCNFGFAIASNTAQKSAADRIPWSGIEAMLIGGPAAAILNLPQPVGLLIQRIAAGSPADRLGLRAGSIRAELEGEEVLLGGDIILAVGGIRLSDENAAPRILDLLRTAPAGEKMALTVLRAGKLYEMEYVVPAR